MTAINYQGLLMVMPTLSANRTIVINSFTQALGAEKITNGTFTTVLTPWATRGTPTTIEVSGDRLHIIADGAGEGTLSNIFTEAVGWYEFAYDLEVISLVGGTGISVYVSNTNGTSQTGNGVGANATRRILWYQSPSLSRGVIYETTAGVTAAEYYGDNVTLKPVTLNPQTTAFANGTFDFSFTLPGSPAINTAGGLIYRGDGSVTDFWFAYLKRNDAGSAWDFYLDSFVTGTATNRITVTGVGTPDTIRVVASGNDHTCYTGASGTFTQRGSVVTNSTHATNTGIRAFYASTFTPLEVRATPG